VIGSTRQVTVWAYGGPADLRKGFDGLSGLVSQGLRQDPLSGDCYLFVNATRKRAKVLLWDGTGLCIYAKRLERGRFACLWREADARVVRLTMSELQLRAATVSRRQYARRARPALARPVCDGLDAEKSCVVRAAMM
jgi:transposase